MTDKLYYQDSYIQTFSTNLIKQSKDEDGHWYVIIEKTAFYPTGGGQPFDQGTINEHKVLNVEEVDGEIRHYLEQPLPESMEQLNGQIDWERRFDHMQQHAGQHILSAAFEELFGYSTVGFHLGNEVLTIDLDTETFSEKEALDAEKLANQIILESRPIETKWVSLEEVSDYPLRKQLSVSENIRLVIIPEFDYNGCGGTHPNSTGEVGMIKILDWSRQSKKTRIQFVCGNRVWHQLHRKQHIILELSKLLNSPEEGMVQSLNRLLDQVKSVDKRSDELSKMILQYEAKELQENSTMDNGIALITKVFQDRSMKEMQMLARMIVTEAKDVIVLLISENESQLQVVAARGEALKVSMKDLLASLLPSINGKGGGNDSFAQGGGEGIISGQQLLESGLNLFKEKDK
ncbi:DHHA1 domain-containing protein [Bacillus sp. CGMCC 1.16607]|uniref:alanyl-tRNA editing protein n=1 Tax=Bacillus sp. CGMCC 1.16607 TaxID=3351842 RepID=UPI003630EC99